MAGYVVGLDNGGTYTKAVVFDEKGKPVASKSIQIDLSLPHDGWVERDMEEIWRANCQVLGGVVEKAGIDPGDILGLSLTGHGKGLYLWGKDGKPAYPGIPSADTRAHAYPAKWVGDGTWEKVKQKTFQAILPSQPVSLLRWFQDNKPEVLDNTRWIFGIKDYVRYRLTGEANAEITDFSGSNLLNLTTRSYDRELLREFGLEAVYDKLPPLKQSMDVCGGITGEAAALTGLAEGTLVTAGMFDIDACAIAMDVTSEEHLCVIAGTWGIHEYIAKQPVTDGPATILNSIYCMDGYYLVEESSVTSASNLEWFLQTFAGSEMKQAKAKGENFYQKIDKLVEKVDPDSHNIFFFPYIFGSNYNPTARASFVGMGADSTFDKICAAVFEGVAFSHNVHAKNLAATRKPAKAMRLAGGVTNSDIWVQIYADVMNLPVEIIQVEELGALGCAMTVLVAKGIYPDLRAAAADLVKVKKRVEPNPENVEKYRRKFERYQAISQALDSFYR